MFILDTMLDAIPAPRESTKDCAPQIISLQIPTDKIREVIGSGGKVIRGIQEDTGATIDIQEDGTVFMAASTARATPRPSASRPSSRSPRWVSKYTGRVVGDAALRRLRRASPRQGRPAAHQPRRPGPRRQGRGRPQHRRRGQGPRPRGRREGQDQPRPHRQARGSCRLRQRRPSPRRRGPSSPRAPRPAPPSRRDKGKDRNGGRPAPSSPRRLVARSCASGRPRTLLVRGLPFLMARGPTSRETPMEPPFAERFSTTIGKYAFEHRMVAVGRLSSA